jgi:hypothetical protein
MPKNRSKYAAIFAVAGTALVFILSAMANGIIGNWGAWLLDWLVNHITMITWLTALLIGAFFLAGFFSISWWRTRHKLSAELLELDRRSEHLLSMDYSLLRLLSILISVDDTDRAMIELVDKLLYDAAQAFPEVRKASLLLPILEQGQPGQLERKYLSVWRSIGWIGERRDAKFYIDRSGHHGGVAAEAFLNKEFIVTKFPRVDGRIEPSRRSYLFFESEHEDLPYQSLVCVPITAGKNARDSECMGVICFDSKHPDTFDAPGVHAVLTVLGKRMAVALEIYQRLQNVCHVPQHKP